MIITIDGPAGSGKSTAARKLAGCHADGLSRRHAEEALPQDD